MKTGSRSTPILSNTTLTIRVYAPGASNGTFSTFMVDKNFNWGPRTDFVLDTLSQGWTDITIPIGAYDGTFDPRTMYQVTMEVGSTGSGPWASPMLIYIDNIRSANGAVHDTFDTSFGNIGGSTMLVVANSTFSWTDKLP